MSARQLAPAKHHRGGNGPNAAARHDGPNHDGPNDELGRGLFRAVAAPRHVMTKGGVTTGSVHAVAPSHAANLVGRGLDAAQSAAAPADKVKKTGTDGLPRGGYGGACSRQASTMQAETRG
jgi:hypothetical protein